jgi:hypothetical protein
MTKSQYIKQFINEGFNERDAIRLAHIYYNQEELSFTQKNKHLFDLTSTVNLLQEQDSSGNYANILGKSDKVSTANRFNNLKPSGIIISDTFNDPLFPIPEPKVDTSKFDLVKVLRQFKDYYGKFNLDFSIWHYIIDFIDNKYYAFNMRPIDMIYPITNGKAKEIIKNNNANLNDESKKFFKEQPFDLSQAIHIKIIGDSLRDVYTKNLYQLLGRICIAPILRMFKLPMMYGQKTISLNMGYKFDTSALDKYIRG